MNVSYCYSSPEHKRALFPRVVIPAIYYQAARGLDVARDWLRAAGIDTWPAGEPQLIALHELARAGKYRGPLRWNCDPPQTVLETITNGGDCDQWASVILAALKVMGYDASLITFGSQGDRFQHVAVAGKTAGTWYILDPKGDQAGLPFNGVDSSYQVVETWPPQGDYARM